MWLKIVAVFLLQFCSTLLARDIPFDSNYWLEVFSERRLLQAPSPGFAPDLGPSPESISVGQPTPASNDTLEEELVCCCRGWNGILPYQKDAPYGCCCGRQSYCCSNNSLITNICGEGNNGCGISMMLVTAILLILISLCMFSRFCAVCRNRRRTMTLGAGASTFNRQSTVPTQLCVELLTLKDEEVDNLLVKESTLEAGAEKECPICLESKSTVSEFPCHHGCCSECLKDLIKFSKKRTDKIHGVACPLCRKLAVVKVTTATEELIASTASSAATSSSTAAALETEQAPAAGPQTERSAVYLLPRLPPFRF